MKVEFTIEGPERIDIVLERSWFTGSFTCTANGEVQTLRSPLNPATHFNLTLKNFYTVEVGPHVLSIEHTRPLMMAGLRPQEYVVSVDGETVASYKGY